MALKHWVDDPRVGNELWGVVYRNGTYEPRLLGRIDSVNHADRSYRCGGKAYGFSACPLFMTRAAVEVYCREHPPRVPTVSGLVSR